MKKSNKLLNNKIKTKSKKMTHSWQNRSYTPAVVAAVREVEIPPFTEEEQRLLYDVMSVQTESRYEGPMIDFILKWLSDKDYKFHLDDSSNIYITKGVADVYPTYVSHMDQVHNTATSFQIYTAGNKWFAFNKNTMSQVGIGGDDKVGIFICLQALLTFDVCKVVFFVAEEIGCVGSRACDMSFFDNSAFVLQSDRNGDQDFISHTNGVEVHDNLWTDKFADILKKYGYSDCHGTCTDVGELKSRGLKVACANLSSGYYRAHTSGEYICLPDVMASWLLCKEIGERTGHEVNPHTAPPKSYQSYRAWEDDWSVNDSGKGKNSKFFKPNNSIVPAKVSTPLYCYGCGTPTLDSNHCESCIKYYMDTYGFKREEVMEFFT